MLQNNLIRLLILVITEYKTSQNNKSITNLVSPGRPKKAWSRLKVAGV